MMNALNLFAHRPALQIVQSCVRLVAVNQHFFGIEQYLLDFALSNIKEWNSFFGIGIFYGQLFKNALFSNFR